MMPLYKNMFQDLLRIRECVIISFIILIGKQVAVLNAVPITAEDIIFKDTWDYAIEPSNEPLLTKESVNHILPPTEKREGKEEPDDFVELKLNNVTKELDPISAIISCPVCKIGATLLQREAKRGSSFEEIRDQFVSICVGFNVQTEPVCEGIINVYGPELLPVLNITELDPPKLCALLLGESCNENNETIYDWNVVLPDAPKPEIKEAQPVAENGSTFKVLHIADTHLDPDYEPGSISNCQEPLCCRPYSTKKKSEDIIPAGKWGSHGKCDVPRVLIENMLQQIAKQHPDIDYIIFTGDLPPHDIWNQTKKTNLEVFEETLQMIYKAFPDIPLFPSLGNHEAVPAGSFPPPWIKHEDHSIFWLYKEAAIQWEKWLPSDVNDTIIHGGFYSVLIRPGFRLISLNMNYCHTLSWWLALNTTDPAKELQWLIYQLEAAGTKGEKVHIIGHIPPGQADCMKVWSRNFYDIIDRYEGTVVAQFYGHTHSDEYEVFYSTKDFKRATNIAYIAPSVTTFQYHNPGYRIYYVDGDREGSTREVIDHETWVMDLNKANAAEDEPVYYKLYSARQAYGMPTLRAKEWDSLIERLREDPRLFQEFYRYYYKDSPVRPNCDAKCKLQLLCDLKSGRSNDRKHLCHDLTKTTK